MTMEIFGFISIVGLAVVLMIWHFAKSASVLEQWATSRGYKLLASERRLLFQGPFWWRTSESQVVFRVTVRDADGGLRHGFVRVGGWFLGMWSNQVDVEWDD